MIDEERICQIAQRKAWRYKFSCDPHHSDTYTFNATTMVNFVRAIEAEGTTRISVLEREHMEFFERWHIERRKREALELALVDAREMVESWAAYAPEYFRVKHNIEGDLAKLDATLCLAKPRHD